MTLHRLIGIGAGLFFNSFLATSVLDLPRNVCYAANTALGLVLLCTALFLFDWKLHRGDLQRWLIMSGLFAVILGSSYLVNFQAYRFSLTFKAVGYYVMFALSTGLALVGGWRSFSACLVTHWAGLWMAMLLTLAVANVNVYNGRLHGPFKKHEVQTSGLHANEVGMLGVTAVLVSTAAGGLAVATTAPAGLLIAWLSGCRGAMIGIVLALLLYVVAREWIAGCRWRAWDVVPANVVWLLAGSFCAILLAAWLGASAIVDQLLLISDERRGLSSGFTGRLDQWVRILEHWQQNPVFGRGYSIVRDDALSEAEHADGGFLLALAEMGIPGLVFFCCLFVGSIRRHLKEIARHGTAAAVCCLTFMIVFGFINLFESRILGTGSIGLGIFFYISALSLTTRMPSSFLTGSALPICSSEQRRLRQKHPHPVQTLP